jgi:hypothetical protein
VVCSGDFDDCPERLPLRVRRRLRLRPEEPAFPWVDWLPWRLRLRPPERLPRWRREVGSWDWVSIERGRVWVEARREAGRWGDGGVSCDRDCRWASHGRRLGREDTGTEGSVSGSIQAREVGGFAPFRRNGSGKRERSPQGVDEVADGLPESLAPRRTRRLDDREVGLKWLVG